MRKLVALALLLGFVAAGTASAEVRQQKTEATAVAKKGNAVAVSHSTKTTTTITTPAKPKAKPAPTSHVSMANRDGAQPFLRGNGGDMNQVADMAERSLARNSSGTSPISQELCNKTRSCITPLELYTEIKDKHPDVGLGELRDLPSYLRTLVKDEHPAAGRRTVGRVLVKNGKRHMDYGYGREPAPGEVIWRDVNTGEEVLMGNCFNIIDLTTLSEVVVTAKCAYHVLHVTDGELNFANMGRYRNDECFKYVYLGASPNYEEGKEYDWLPLPTRCPEKPCEFSSFENYFHLPIMQSGGLRVKAGYYVFAVTRDFAKNPGNVAVYCHNHSCGIDIHPDDYRKGDWGGYQASIFITKSEAQAKAEGRKLYWAEPGKECPDH